MNDDTTLLVKTHQGSDWFSRAIFSIPKAIHLGAGVFEEGEFSEFRYVLTREWNDKLPSLACIGLNPSKADEKTGDRTVNKMIRLCKLWGFGMLIMLNAGAYRATKPKHWLAAPDPIGPDNDRLLIEWARRASKIMLGWGTNAGKLTRVAPSGAVMTRHEYLMGLLYEELPKGTKVYSMDLTKGGYPAHPLYLSESLPLVENPWIVKINRGETTF